MTHLPYIEKSIRWSDVRDSIKTKTSMNDSMNTQESEGFQTSKFYCKTNFDMTEIAAEEADYKKFPLPKFYQFKSAEDRERILYKNFLTVNEDVKNMIREIQLFNSK